MVFEVVEILYVGDDFLVGIVVFFEVDFVDCL